MFLLSLPMRERGLKYRIIVRLMVSGIVAPHAGAWIEIQAQNDAIDAQIMSLPMRERGLKYERDARAGTRYSRSPCGSVD